jgi:uncharacterized protein with HEPN domain
MKDERFPLVEILERLRRIEQFTSQGRAEFFADVKIQDAVLRNLEVIGEAVKRVSASTRLRYPDVPRKRMAGLRDVIIHQYEGILLTEIWRIVEEEVPPLRNVMERVVGDLV